jgi:hypothetical protein
MQLSVHHSLSFSLSLSLSLSLTSQREREREYGCFIFILKGMTGTLAPFSYLVFESKTVNIVQIYFSRKYLGQIYTLYLANLAV